MSTSNAPFILPIRVYYEDTDAGGIVYHSIYLNYMERARTEWLMARGINLHQYALDEQKMFVVRDLSIQYLRPAHLCDDLTVKTYIDEMTRTRLYFIQTIHRGDQILTKGRVEIVCIDTQSGRPLAIPSIFNNKE